MELQFKSCNHGCRAKRAAGQSTNGRCRFPDLNKLSTEAVNILTNHPDPRTQRFAEEVHCLIEHIEQGSRNGNPGCKNWDEDEQQCMD